MQRDIEVEPLLDDGDEHIDRDGDPDLALDRVLGSAEEALDAKMRLDPLEEQLDLPAALVERTDRQGRELEMVGQKHQRLGCFGVLEFGKLSLEVNTVPEQNLVEEPWFDTRASRSAWN